MVNLNLKYRKFNSEKKNEKHSKLQFWKRKNMVNLNFKIIIKIFFYVKTHKYMYIFNNVKWHLLQAY
jgi:hypothetical protein